MYELYVETDDDFSFMFNGMLFAGCPETLFINDFDDLNDIEVLGPHGTPHTDRTKSYEFIMALDHIKAKPTEEYNSLGGNRGVKWAKVPEPTAIEGDMITYSNEFGVAKFELVTRDRMIGEISSQDVPENCFIDIDTAEQIALITGNDGIQLSFEFIDNKIGRPYIINNSTPKVGCIARLLEIEYTGDTPAHEELETVPGIMPIHLG